MLNIVTWNVKGLRSPHKQGMILRHLHKRHTDVALFQETHLPEKDFGRMKKRWVGEVVGSLAMGKKAGVLILIRKGVRINLISSERDDIGRRVSILAEEGGSEFRVTNLYAPNSPSTAYFQELSAWLGLHTERMHYIAGDFNCTATILKDRTKRSDKSKDKRDTNNATPLALFLSSMQLIDIWRYLNRQNASSPFTHPLTTHSQGLTM